MNNNELLNKLCEKVQSAGKIILEADRSPDMIDSKEGHSNFVTTYDKKVQEVLRHDLLAILPDAHFVGEEDDIHEEGLPNGYVFIVDPIDGTTNFIKDLHASTISVALLKDNEQFMAIIYNPYSNEMFTAIKGAGAHLNGKPIHVSDNCLKDGIIIFGTAPYYAELNKKSMETATYYLDKCIDIRRTGAATIDLVNVACGRAEMYFEMRLQPWDHAAGSLIVREAGGIVTTFDGEDTCYDKPISILATNAVVREEIK